MVDFGFRKGRNNITGKNLMNFAKLADFIRRSTAMKFYIGIGLLLALAGTSLQSVLPPEMQGLATAGIVFILLATIASVYGHYVLALSIGVMNYRYIKYIGITLISTVLGFILPSTIPGILISLAGVILGIGIFYAKKSTIQDAFIYFAIVTALGFVLALLGLSGIIIAASTASVVTPPL